MSNKLFVGNLSFNTTENDLQDAFAAFGTVTETNLMMDRTTNRPRGFGFVTMSSAEEAQKAIDGLNGKDMGGRTLTVNVARPRCEEPSGWWRRYGRREYGVAAAAATAAAAAVAVVIATNPPQAGISRRGSGESESRLFSFAAGLSIMISTKEEPIAVEGASPRCCPARCSA